MDNVLKLLQRSGSTPNSRKCSFFADSMDYLGHITRRASFKVYKGNQMAVKDAKEPGEEAAIRSFIDLF